MRIESAVLIQRAMNEVTARYKKLGYSVVQHPTDTDLPGFLRKYSPDLIAVGKGETVVVEITSDVSTEEAERFSRLTKEVTRHPNHRFELIVAKPRDLGFARENWEVLDEQEIRSKLHTATDVMKADGSGETSFLLIWRLIEAWLRNIAAKHKVAHKALGPNQLIRELATTGIITDDECVLLEGSLGTRNEIVHGFRSVLNPKGLATQLKLLLEKKLRPGGRTGGAQPQRRLAVR